MDTTLIVIGIGCIIGAIVGGGVKLAQVEFSPVTSLWRQMLLGGFGVILVVSGMIVGGHLPGGGGGSPGAPADLAATAPEGGAAAPASPSGAATPSPPLPEPSPAPVARASAPPAIAPAPPAPAALPGKVDIFWCAGDDGAANSAIAGSVERALAATGRIARVRVRPLGAAVNAQPDYRIDRDIVRFDPGEQPSAEAIAAIATGAADATFRAEHALPGAPSIDYLSVFVCAPR